MHSEVTAPIVAEGKQPGAPTVLNVDDLGHQAIDHRRMHSCVHAHSSKQAHKQVHARTQTCMHAHMHQMVRVVWHEPADDGGLEIVDAELSFAEAMPDGAPPADESWTVVQPERPGSYEELDVTVHICTCMCLCTHTHKHKKHLSMRAHTSTSMHGCTHECHRYANVPM